MGSPFEQYSRKDLDFVTVKCGVSFYLKSLHKTRGSLTLATHRQPCHSFIIASLVYFSQN